jgi:heat shock protein HspQ
MLRKTAGEQVASMHKRVVRLEAICEEQDEQLAAIVEYQNKQDKVIELLQEAISKLKKSVGGNYGPIADCSAWHNDYEPYVVSSIDPVLVNNVEVSTEHCKLCNNEGRVKMNDFYHVACPDCKKDIVTLVEEAHACTGYQDHLSQKDADKLQQQVEEPDVTMKDAAPVYLNPKYDGPVGP